MKKEWDTVEVLRHVRHDWLNKLQLIKGNIDLNKIDRTKEIIREIIVETQNESKLSNMNIPHFTMLLLTHNWGTHSFQLEFDIIDTLKCKRVNDEELVRWTSNFFGCLNESVNTMSDNHLCLTIEPQETTLRFFFDFCGIIERQDEIEQFLQSNIFGIRVKQYNISDNEFTLEVFIPYL